MPYIHEGPSLYLAEDQKTIVDAGDLRAAHLLVAEGGTLPDDIAARYGIKAKYSAPNKAKAAPENKGLTIEHDDTPRTIKMGRTKS